MDYWNHNTAYYKWIKKQTVDCHSILDVGCGDGALIVYLNDGSKELLGIDPEQSCIVKAHSRCKAENIAFMCLGFENLDTDRKFDAIVFVASLHHMNMKPSIEKAKSLLKDDGILLVVGLAKPTTVIDYIIEGLRVIPSNIISRIKRMKTCESENIPVSYDFPSMNAVRKNAKTLLPGCSIKYGLFYRFLLKWTK